MISYSFCLKLNESSNDYCIFVKQTGKTIFNEKDLLVADCSYLHSKF